MSRALPAQGAQLPVTTLHKPPMDLDTHALKIKTKPTSLLNPPIYPPSIFQNSPTAKTHCFHGPLYLLGQPRHCRTTTSAATFRQLPPIPSCRKPPFSGRRYPAHTLIPATTNLNYINHLQLSQISISASGIRVSANNRSVPRLLVAHCRFCEFRKNFLFQSSPIVEPDTFGCFQCPTLTITGQTRVSRWASRSSM